jgi:hypothetical protein
MELLYYNYWFAALAWLSLGLSCLSLTILAYRFRA